MTAGDGVRVVSVVVDVSERVSQPKHAECIRRQARGRRVQVIHVSEVWCPR